MAAFPPLASLIIVGSLKDFSSSHSLPVLGVRYPKPGLTQVPDLYGSTGTYSGKFVRVGYLARHTFGVDLGTFIQI
jgi:hypothetical protein